MTDDFYDRSLKRMNHLALAFGAAGLIAVLIFYNWRSAVGFGCGALISSINFRLWKRLANAIGDSGEAPTDSNAVLLGARYIMMAVAVFGTIRFLEVSPWTVLSGLFVSVAALFTELVCQLIFIRD